MPLRRAITPGSVKHNHSRSSILTGRLRWSAAEPRYGAEKQPTRQKSRPPDEVGRAVDDNARDSAENQHAASDPLVHSHLALYIMPCVFQQAYHEHG
jgi:hypothetical protein